MTTPEPGIYGGVPFEVYKTWDAMNVSTLRWAKCSARHLSAAIKGELAQPDSPDMLVGRAVHCRLLEPERYAVEWHVAEPCMALLKSGSRKGQPCGAASAGCNSLGTWLCGTHAKGETFVDLGEVLSVKEAAHVEAVNNSVKRHPVVNLLRQHGGAETCVVWDADGVRIKNRLDKWIPGGTCPPTVIDLKTMRVGTGRTDDIRKTIANHGYHVQAAAYLAGIEAVTGVEANFVWVFVEKEPPFDVNVIQANRETLGQGRTEFEQLLETYRYTKTFLDAGREPPGYAEDIQLDGLPAWYYRQWHHQHYGTEQTS